MTAYLVPEFTLEQRVDVTLQMLLPFPLRRWGLVSELARTYGVSRTLLYALRDRTLAAVLDALQPRAAGRPAAVTTLTVDQACIERTIAILPLLKGSVRDIRLGLDLLLGVTRSVGHISQTLQAAGERALAYNLQLTVPLPVLGEADEIFQGRQPCLTLVDGRSFLVLNLTPAAARDATTWGVTLLDQPARGVQFQDLVCDGAPGLRAGVREAQLVIPVPLDLFHQWRDAHRLAAQLERTAYAAIRQAERARRAEREAQAPKRRRGKPLQVAVARPEAEAQEAQAIAAYDGCVWLLRELRAALEPLTPTGRLLRVAEARATLETGIALLREFGQAAITTCAKQLQAQLDDLLAPLAWLEQHLAGWRSGLDAATEAFLGWSWQHRQALGVDLARDFPAALQPVGCAWWEALALFHRSSSLAEALHSWLRPYLQIHRGMPRWLLPLLQLYWNHHAFERGQRAGNSPLELAEVEGTPSLKEVLNRLFGGRPAEAPG